MGRNWISESRAITNVEVEAKRSRFCEHARETGVRLPDEACFMARPNFHKAWNGKPKCSTEIDPILKGTSIEGLETIQLTSVGVSLARVVNPTRSNSQQCPRQ
jgi:hypothetical protein